MQRISVQYVCDSVWHYVCVKTEIESQFYCFERDIWFRKIVYLIVCKLIRRYLMPIYVTNGIFWASFLI